MRVMTHIYLHFNGENVIYFISKSDIQKAETIA